MDEDMHGPLGDTHEVVLALSAMVASLSAALERESPGTLASVARTAEDIIANALAADPVLRDKAIAHVSRLSGQAARLLHRGQQP